MKAAWRIAAKDLRLRTRDKTIFVVGIIAPLVLAYIFNAIFGAAMTDVGAQVRFPVGLYSADRGTLGVTFGSVVDEVADQGLLDLRRYSSRTAANAAVENGEVSAAWVVPSGFTDDFFADNPVEIEVIGNVDAPTVTGVASSIARQFAIGLRAAKLASNLSVATGVVDPSDFQVTMVEAGMAPQAIGLGTVETSTRQLGSNTYFVAGLSIFFMFFIAGMTVTSMLDEREEGTLPRLLAAPISRWSVIAGKALSTLLMSMGSMTVLIIASSFLMGAEWGHPLGVGLLAFAATLAAVSIMALVGGMAKTAEQANNLEGVVATVMALLGGTFIPIATSGILANLSLITPNAWFIRGLGDLAGGGVGAVMPAFAALMAMALVSSVGALALIRKLVHA